MTLTRCCMVATVTLALAFQFACNSSDKKVLGDFDEERGAWTNGAGLTADELPTLSTTDPAGDSLGYWPEEDILGFDASQDGPAVVVTITFDGDHRARFEAGDGSTIVVQFENKDDFIDSWIEAFKEKVVDGKARITHDWSEDGSQIIVRFEGDFTMQDVQWVRVETLGSDEATVSAR